MIPRFRLLFGENGRNQKDISKLTNLYYGTKSRIVFVLFFGRVENTKKTFRN